MVVTIGNYEFLVKEEHISFDGHHSCSGCFYENEPNAVCTDVGDDLEPQLDESMFHPIFGGCGLRKSILIPNTTEGLLTYLEEKLNHD